MKLKILIFLFLQLISDQLMAQQLSLINQDNFDNASIWYDAPNGSYINNLVSITSLFSIENNSLQVANYANGFLEPGYIFGNSQESSIHYRYFSTANYYNVKIMFNWRCNGELDRDYGSMYYSTDAVTWTLLKKYQSGEGNNIKSESFLLPKCIQNSGFFLGYSFTSDNSFNFQPGLVIDNIELHGSFCNASNTPPYPSLNSYSNKTVCYNDVQTLELSASSTTQDLRWYNSYSCEEYFYQGQYFNALPLESKTYYVTAFNPNNGCESYNKLPINLTVLDLPVLENISITNAVYGNDGAIDPTLSGYPTLSYSWDLESDNSFTSISEDLFYINEGNYTLTVTDGHYCKDSFKIIVLSGTELDIPEGISPNADGFNDSWIITGIQQWTDFSVELRNMRGELVYLQNATYNPVYVPMNGIDVNGEKLPAGDYSYLIRSKIKKKKYTGILSIKYD